MDLIDGNALYQDIKTKIKASSQDGANVIDAVLSLIEDAPTVDPVVHAHNLNKDYPSLFKCSNCGWSDDDTYTGDTDTYNYCPHCGARMDEVEE